MAPRRLPLLTGLSLVVALLLVATASAGTLAAPRGSAGVSARTTARTETAPAAAAKAKRLSDLKLTPRAAGTRGSVNVRRLAAKKPTKRMLRTKPFLTRADGTVGTKPSGGPKVLAVAPPDPVEAAPNGDGPAAQTSFDGVARSTGVAFDGEPPDPWVAVGPEHIVQAVNLNVRITDRQGGNITDITLPDFFELPLDTFDADPHVIYDSLHGRWLATEVSWDCTPDLPTDPLPRAQHGHGYFDLAVSRTSDPTGIWDQSFVYFNDALPDYPAPGTTTDKIGLASNLFGMVAGTGADCVADTSPFLAADVLYVDWADVLDRGSLTVLESYFPDSDPDHPTQHWFTPRVAVQAPATSARMQVVAQFDYGSGTIGLGYVSLVGSVRATSLPAKLHYERLDSLTEEFPVVAPFVDPPVPTQPGAPGTIVDAVDSRPTDAIWQGDRLVLVSTTSCQPTGDSTQRDCVRVTELNTSPGPALPPTLTQDFLVASNGQDSYMGGIGLTGNGTLHVGWTRSSATAGDFPSSYTAHRSVGDAPNSISEPELLGQGTGVYPGTRWGDYVGIAQDPQVPNRAWDGNEFSVGSAGWATMITRLQTQGTTYVPITPLRVLDTRTTTGGLKGGFTAGTPRSWQVGGVGTIPTGAVAVTGNVTVTGQTAAGYVAVTVTSTSTPSSSTINFPISQTRANNLTIPLTAGGRLSAVYKAGSGKKTQLLLDVTGYFLADDSGSTFTPLAAPRRALDTRNGTGLPGAFSANVSRTLVIGGGPTGVPLGATAITGNLTIVGPTQAGFAAVTRTPTNSPPTSTINFPAGSNRANGVFAPLDPTSHALSIVYRAPTGAKANILLDITGYFESGTGGLRFVPMTPSRIMDSRATTGLSGIKGKFTSSVPKTLPVQGHWGVPVDAQAVTGNLTVAGQTAAGFVSATPNPTANPPTSTINFPLGDTLANGIVTPLNGSGNSSFVYKSGAGKTTNLILDLSGYFE